MIDWTEEDKEYMKTHTAKETARHKGCSLGAVYDATYRLGILGMTNKDKNIEKMKPYFGTMTDRELSKMFNMSTVMVGNYRRSLGIEPFRKHGHHKYTKEYLEQLHDELGTWKAVGEKLGCTKQSISQMYRSICSD